VDGFSVGTPVSSTNKTEFAIINIQILKLKVEKYHNPLVANGESVSPKTKLKTAKMFLI
jgi:hypothetical protein